MLQNSEYLLSYLCGEVFSFCFAFLLRWPVVSLCGRDRTSQDNYKHGALPPAGISLRNLTPSSTIPWIVSLLLNLETALSYALIIFLGLEGGGGFSSTHMMGNTTFILKIPPFIFFFRQSLSPELRPIYLTVLKVPQIQHIQMSSLPSPEYKHAFVPGDRTIHPIAQDKNIWF